MQQLSKNLVLDIDLAVSNFNYNNRLNGSSILVTGATGLIGSLTIRILSNILQSEKLSFKLYALARQKDKVEHMFSDIENIEWIYGSVEDFTIPNDVEYIIHGASPTSSKFYCNNPVETISTIVQGTTNVLKQSARINCNSIIFLSSLESYGSILNGDNEIYESDSGYIDPADVRSSYSLGKKMAECVCSSYFSEYKVPVKIARLTQVFGAGVLDEDTRVFAQFAKSIINDKNIVLHTQGLSSKPYCYTIDAINAIFTILFDGNNGEVYNVANPSTYISIKDMAQMLIREFNPSLKLDTQLMTDSIYASETKLNLNTSKLESLGWEPVFNLKEMFTRLINYYNEK